MLKIRIEKRVVKYLKKLPPKHGRQIRTAIESLLVTPIRNDTKKLEGYNNYLRIDVGEYRIVYQLLKPDSLLIIILVGKRNDSEVYKKLSRLS